MIRPEGTGVLTYVRVNHYVILKMHIISASQALFHSPYLAISKFVKWRTLPFCTKKTAETTWDCLCHTICYYTDFKCIIALDLSHSPNANTGSTFCKKRTLTLLLISFLYIKHWQGFLDILDCITVCFIRCF